MSGQGRFFAREAIESDSDTETADEAEAGYAAATSKFLPGHTLWKPFVLPVAKRKLLIKVLLVL